METVRGLWGPPYPGFKYLSTRVTRYPHYELTEDIYVDKNGKLYAYHKSFIEFKY